MLLRSISAGLALLASLALAACGGATTALHTSLAPAGATATRTVRYLGAILHVPADWPVYNLAADPHRCARLDVHAVYLGHQGPEAACPAYLVGKTEAVQAEPLDDQTRAHLLPGAASRQISGQPATIQAGSDVSHEVVATFPTLGVVVTATFSADRPTAEAIVDTVRANR